jgi:uncharacterized membrane protein
MKLHTNRMSIFELFIYSAVPFTEQRITIPLGIIYYDYSPLYITMICFLGALIPAPFILLLFSKAYDIASGIKFFDPLTGFIDKKVRKRSKRFELYKELALITFVGIPLPGTGVWTGSVIAAMLGLDLKKSMMCIVAGNFISAAILLVISLLFPFVLGNIG